jgi:uncharacterized protein YodC (DUF2158 family)
MDVRFQRGDLVRQSEIGLEMRVEGYNEAGRVICSFVKGIARIRTSFPETELEKVPPPLPSARRSHG